MSGRLIIVRVEPVSAAMALIFVFMVLAESTEFLTF
jgi:hypothetical protein